MTITVGGSVITFNDGTTQSTAAGAIPTTLYAVGTYVLGRPANGSAYGVNSTISGSSLYATSANGYYAICPPGFGNSSGPTLVNTGSWRCLSPAHGNGAFGWTGLWVRYA